MIHADISKYNEAQTAGDLSICALLATSIEASLPEAENKVWHGHPVWFLDGNPIVGYSRLEGGVRLLFWSGQSFRTPGLRGDGKVKAAEVRFTSAAQVDPAALSKWLSESREVQWDCKNIVRRKGKLERLK